MARRLPRTAAPGGRAERLLAGGLALAAGSAVVLFGGVRWWTLGPAAIGLFLAVALLGLRFLARPGGAAPVTPPGLALLAVIPLYLLARIAWRSLTPGDAHGEFLVVAVYLAAYLGWSQLRAAGARWRFWVGAFLFLASLLCWYAIVLDARGGRMVLWMERPAQYGMRASATFGNPNHFGHFLVIAFSCALAFLLTPRSGVLLRILSFYSLVLIPWALFLTLSRGAFVGLLASLLAVPLVLAVRRGGRRLVAGAVLAPLLAGGLAVAFWNLSPAWRARALDSTQAENMRYRLWKDTLTLWKAQPAWGSGPGSFAHALSPHRHHLHEPAIRPLQAHSEPLHALAEHGLAGTGLLVLGGLGALVALLRALARGGDAEADAGWMAALAGAWAGSIAQSFMEFNLHIPGNVLLLSSLSGLAAARLASLGRLGRGKPRPALTRVLGAGLLLAGILLALDALRFYRADQLRREWTAALDAGEPALALAAAREAARVRPDFAEAHLVAGQALQRQAFWLRRQPRLMAPLLAEAETRLLRAIALNAMDLDARIALARVRLLQGRVDEGVALANRVAADAPALVFYHLEQARVLVDARRHEEALRAFQQARRLDQYSEAAWSGVHAMKRLLGLPIHAPQGAPPRPGSGAVATP